MIKEFNCLIQDMNGKFENIIFSINNIVILRSRRQAGRRMQGIKRKDCWMHEGEDEEKVQEEGEVEGAEDDCGYVTPISYKAEQRGRQEGGRGEVISEYWLVF